VDVAQRRDNWSRETVRSQRRKLRNLRAELLKQTEPRKKDRARAYDRGMAAGMRDGAIKVERIEETLSLMAQQQAWYRDRFRYIASLLRSSDWRGRAVASLDLCMDSLAWLAEDANRQPMFPPAAAEGEG
jgi:hypothetical protein